MCVKSKGEGKVHAHTFAAAARRVGGRRGPARAPCNRSRVYAQEVAAAAAAAAAARARMKTPRGELRGSVRGGE